MHMPVEPHVSNVTILSRAITVTGAYKHSAGDAENRFFSQSDLGHINTTYQAHAKRTMKQLQAILNVLFGPNLLF